MDWKHGRRGLAGLGQDELEALRHAARRWDRSDGPLPPSCVRARAVFIPKGKSDEICKLRPILPATPEHAATTKTLLATDKKELAPKWTCAEGFIQGGCADAHFVTMRILMERCVNAWGVSLPMFETDHLVLSGDILLTGRSEELRSRQA